MSGSDLTLCALLVLWFFQGRKQLASVKAFFSVAISLQETNSVHDIIAACNCYGLVRDEGSVLFPA